MGTKRFPAWPIAPEHGGPRGSGSHAPLLGEHNDEVFASVGMTTEELDVLRADAVIGTRPAGL